jgi:UDP-N-acetylmuramate--alanine ligase
MSRLDQIELSSFCEAYFIGIGGIGMSALARYFKSKGWNVAGYDKTQTALTNDLIKEGIKIHFEDIGVDFIKQIEDASRCLFIYTPAIPPSNKELCSIREKSLPIFKRSEVLGLITREGKCLGVAGTHGKTTTSAMLAHVLNEINLGCNAFLGGIATNFNSNLIVNPSAEYTVIEADEFDRSFLQLRPFASIVTSTDSDHLDIYGDSDEFLNGFQQYAKLINPHGVLVKREGLDISSDAKTLTYAINSLTSDYSGSRLRVLNEYFCMDVRTPFGNWNDVELGIPGIHNAENAVACIAMLHFIGLSEEFIRKGLRSFKGVKRRFEYHVKTERLVYIDDYAHHPTEIRALISSVRLLYPNRKVTGIFQPHLFTRTRDFFEGFASELSKLDEVILMPIYPARELPVPGVTSEALLEAISCRFKYLFDHQGVIDHLKVAENEVVLTIGAGDIDRIVEPISVLLR